MKKIILLLSFLIITGVVDAAEIISDADFSKNFNIAEPSNLLAIPSKSVKSSVNEEIPVIEKTGKTIETEQKNENNKEIIKKTDIKTETQKPRKLSRKQKKELKALEKKEKILKEIEQKRLEKEYLEKAEYDLKMSELKAKQDKIREEALKKQQKEELKQQKKAEEKKLQEFAKKQKIRSKNDKKEFEKIQNSLTAEPWKHENTEKIDIYKQIEKEQKNLKQNNSDQKQIDDITNSIMSPKNTDPKNLKKKDTVLREQNIKKDTSGIEAEENKANKKLTKSDYKKILKSEGIKYESKEFLSEAEKNNTKTVEYFLKAGMSADVKAESETTPLIWACYNGNMEMVKMLISYGANVNWSNKDGFTPLMAAVETNNLKIVKYLLQNKAKVNVATLVDKTTPLHIACYNGDKECAEILVVAGANVNAKNSHNITPIITAALYGNEEIIDYLKSSGAVLNKDNATELALGMISNGNSKNTGFLIELGANINISDKNGKTLLHTSVENKDLRNTELLIKNGANPNAEMKTEDDNNITPLLLAVIADDFDIVKLLIENGASIDVKEKNLGAAPLDIAILLNKNNNITNLLIEKGADINSVMTCGITPSDIALAVGNKEILAELISKGGLFGKETGVKFVKYGCSMNFEQEKGLYKIKKDDAISAYEKFRRDNSEIAEYKKYMDRTHKFRSEREHFVADKHSINIYPLLYGRI